VGGQNAPSPLPRCGQPVHSAQGFPLAPVGVDPPTCLDRSRGGVVGWSGGVVRPERNRAIVRSTPDGRSPPFLGPAGLSIPRSPGPKR
jgi:hypothetical protein